MKGKFDMRHFSKLRFVISALIFFYVVIVVYNVSLIKQYRDIVLPNSYLGDYAIGDYKYTSLDDFIEFINGVENKKKLKIVVNGRENEYTYSDVGLHLDTDGIIDEIKKSQNHLTYTKRISLINSRGKKIYDFKYKVNEEESKQFLEKIKNETHQDKQDGHFQDDGYTLSYVKGVNSFDLDIDKSMDVLQKTLANGAKENAKVELIGNSEIANNNDSYATIDTMVSSFTTYFNQYEYARAQNLYTALSYINGAVVMPGETFSYYNYAGPFNKAGYVFYYEFVGNGVCQIATTTYNAALLGGLEIVKRYPHAAKSVYVAGGLDATVASYSSGWYVDMAWKNTYDYPIYVRAYHNGGSATVELWSNHDAKRGYTYETESVQIGYRGYQSYLHVYKDGQEVERRFIATTWYIKD